MVDAAPVIKTPASMNMEGFSAARFKAFFGAAFFAVARARRSGRRW